MAHFSVKQRSPYRKSFMPSRRQTGPVYLATVSLRYTRRRLGGRQPLCGIGVTSLMDLISTPAACRARMADSRPEPGPLTRMSSERRPASLATAAAADAACCAAKGVPLRDPLNPSVPALDQVTTWPSMSVMVTCVLLKEAWMWATPWTTWRFSFLGFLELDFLVGTAGAAAETGSAIRFLPYGLLGAAALGRMSARRGPLRVRALVWVRWPRTGRLRRWRI